VQHAGSIISSDGNLPVQAGTFLADRDDVAQLIVAVTGGRPVYLQDVATVTLGPDQPDQYVTFGTGPAAAQKNLDLQGTAPAVTLAVSKKPGENAIDVTDAVLARMAQLRGTYVPEGVEVTVTRNYGETANDKAVKLIQKLMFATGAVVLLVWLAVGWREAVVVGAAVVITLAATLFASWAWGFTINRVSLFALIFAIGILVDDAIVVVENIHRHMGFGGSSTLGELIPRAVDEVGGPTILATFTVIAALLPMAFVSGLMGPYMSPIPINASMGMLISLAIALMFTPWLSKRLLAHAPGQAESPHDESRLHRFFEKLMSPFLRGDAARSHRHKLYLGTLAAIVLAVSLAAVQWVVMKMLPFDNKSEFQVVVDMPEGTPVEETARVLDELAAAIAHRPEVTDYQVYAGTSAPINFNGLVRQYYLRSGHEVGDIQVNLVDKHHRDKQSHEIALEVRPALAEIGRKYGASVKVVEVPPGPPVQAPLVAEVYGPFQEAQQKLTREIRAAFDSTPGVVDVDDSIEAPNPRLIVTIDRQKAALLGVRQADATQALAAGLGGIDATYLQLGRETYPIPVRLELDVPDKTDLASVLALRVRSRTGGGHVALSEITTVERKPWDNAIYHKDLLPLSWVTADSVGETDSPLYGMFALVGSLDDKLPPGTDLQQSFFSQPADPYRPSLKWDGEWQITYETFRDMGLAYSVGLVLIYLLVVAQFGSYAVPLVIMAPIPLTIIGVMPGHALLGAQFTATSMIGMIALAGIIVRNSILLVDFINLEIAAGRALADAVIRAASVRARPIALTAVAAMTGAFFILDDPIFNGLAVSLIFGILVSTALTLMLIPILYFSYRNRSQAVGPNGQGG
jgi:multidrug efflux pump subunit AcrB